MAVTVDSFLESVKRLITLPANQALLDDSAILALADETSQSYVVPLFLSLRQEYFVTSLLQPVTINVDTYNVPERSIMRGLRDLKFRWTGDPQAQIRQMTQIAIEDIQMFPASSYPCGYYFKGDKIVIIPSPNLATGTLEIWYYLQPGKLVKTTAAARVESISGDTVTVETVPLTFVAGVPADFVQGISGNSTLAMDKVISSIAGNQITFDLDAVPLTLVAGDYVTLATETPVVQIPTEGIPFFTSKTCIRVLNAIGDYDGMAKLEEIAAQQDKTIKILAEPRNTSEAPKIVPRWGLLRQGRTMFRRGYWGA